MPIKSTTITVPAPQVAYTPTPDYNAEFAGQVAVALMTLTPGAEVWVSFDGVNDHAHLVAGSAAPGYGTSQPYQKVWLRGAGAVVAVQIIVESIRS